MAHDKADDLTAERAAKLYSLLHATISHDGIFGPDDIKAIRKMEIVDKALIIAALQAARQEALREASQAVRNRALLWRSHGGAKVGFPYGHLTIEGEYESMADELDRLASEGAPAPIDLLPKLKDDGGYGEHF